MKPLLIIILFVYLLTINENVQKSRHDILREAKKLESDIVKLKQDIQGLDIMQGSTAEFIARVDRLAEQSERRRK